MRGKSAVGTQQASFPYLHGSLEIPRPATEAVQISSVFPLRSSWANEATAHGERSALDYKVGGKKIGLAAAPHVSGRLQPGSTSKSHPKKRRHPPLPIKSAEMDIHATCSQAPIRLEVSPQRRPQIAGCAF